ncbi:MAG: M20/M25/M40 family metallo-hydrolase, partial [Planctomycetota bacterium]
MMLLVLFPFLVPCFQDDPAVTAPELRAHVRFLAGDALQGRRAGTPFAGRAAFYLAGALAEAGLEPAGEDGSWFQSFEIDLPPEAGNCRLQFPGSSQADLDEWSGLGTLELSATAKVTAPLVSVGYGTVLESHGLDPYADSRAKGKIVLMRRYTEFGPAPPAEYAPLGNLRVKVRHAAEAGAVGVILGTHPDEVAKGGKAVIPFDSAPGTMSIPVVTVAPERFAQLEGVLAEKGSAGLGPVVLHAEVKRLRARTENVLGLLPGKSPETLVLGAHYDHLGWGGEGSLAPGVHAIHNGADDNASGTAMLLEIAEALADAGEPPERSILIALWGAEEEGLLGSQYWVAHPTVARGRILCNVNLDMVGRPASGSITVGSQNTADAFLSALKDAQEEVPDLELALSQGDLPGGGGSDHMSFLSQGIPALFFFSGLHADYHKPGDDWEKLDFDTMAVLGDQVLILLDDLTRADRESFAFHEPVQEKREPGPRSGERVWFGSIPDYGARPEGGGMWLAG